MRKLAVLIFLLAILVVPSGLSQSIVQCIDSNTTLQVNSTYEIGTPYNITHVNVSKEVHCPYGCVNNRCASTNVEADMGSVWLVFAIGISLLMLGTLLGMPFGKLSGKESLGKFFDTQMAVRYLFFFVGIFFLYLSLTMARRIGADYGGIGDVTSATDTATMVTLITIILFLFLFIVETLFYIVKRIGDANLKKKYGEREFGEQ